jgi:hypothetical protein
LGFNDGFRMSRRHGLQEVVYSYRRSTGVEHWANQEAKKIADAFLAYGRSDDLVLFQQTIIAALCRAYESGRASKSPDTNMLTPVANLTIFADSRHLRFPGLPRGPAVGQTRTAASM